MDLGVIQKSDPTQWMICMASGRNSVAAVVDEVLVEVEAKIGGHQEVGNKPRDGDGTGCHVSIG
jgi:hypothetical protein